jgi:hypothetical protein
MNNEQRNAFNHIDEDALSTLKNAGSRHTFIVMHSTGQANEAHRKLTDAIIAAKARPELSLVYSTATQNVARWVQNGQAILDADFKHLRAQRQIDHPETIQIEVASGRNTET